MLLFLLIAYLTKCCSWKLTIKFEIFFLRFKTYKQERMNCPYMTEAYEQFMEDKEYHWNLKLSYLWCSLQGNVMGNDYLRISFAILSYQLEITSSPIYDFLLSRSEHCVARLEVTVIRSSIFCNVMREKLNSRFPKTRSL